MPEFNPSQAKALDALVKEHGDAQGIARGKKGIDVTFPSGNIFRIGTRGKVTLLGAPMTPSADPERVPAEEDGGASSVDGNNDAAPRPPAGADSSLSSQPPPTLLAGSPDDEAYRALTAADDQQIASDLQGNAALPVLYSFNQGGKTVTDLSWKGVHEGIRIVNTRGYGRVGIVKGSAVFKETTTTVLVDGEDVEVPAITVRVEAADELNGGSYYGSATQPMKTVFKKKLRPDTFAEAKALSKAQRNALRPFIPVTAVEELKALFKGEGSVQYIPGTGRPTEIEKPAALDDEKAEALLAEADDLYDQYKRADRNWTANLPPRKFYLFKQDSWTSHKRLEDFVAFMKTQLEEAQKDAG